MASPTLHTFFFGRFGLVWFWGFLAIAEVGVEDIAVAEVMLSVSAWEYRALPEKERLRFV